MKKVSVISGAVALVAFIVNMVSYKGRSKSMLGASAMCVFGSAMGLIGDILYSDDYE